MPITMFGHLRQLHQGQYPIIAAPSLPVQRAHLWQHQRRVFGYLRLQDQG